MPTFIKTQALYNTGQYRPSTVPYVSVDIGLSPAGDFILDPTGGFNIVTGNQKLIQDIKLFLLSPVGSSLIDPNWGNVALSLLGQAEQFQGQLESAVGSALANLKTFKDREAAKRPLEASELIDSIVSIVVAPENATDNQVSVTIEITTHQDEIITVRIPLT